MSGYLDQPAMLLVALVALPLGALGWWAMRGADRLRRVTVISLRTLLMLALAVMLAGPHLAQEHDDLTVIGLLDVSGSVRRFAQIPKGDRPAEQRTYVETMREWFRTAIEDRTPDDRFGLVVFDGDAIAVLAPSHGDHTGVEDEDLEVTTAPGTGIAEAIRLGLAMFPSDTARRLVLVSDGNETMGDALEAARQVAGASSPDGGTPGVVPIDVLPVAYRVTGDVQIVRLETPPSARPGQTVTVRVVMEATQRTRGRLILRREGTPVDLNGAAPGRSREITLPEGQSVHLASVVLAETPVNRFEAIFEPADPAADVLADNDRAEAFTSTPGRGRVLVVRGGAGTSHDPHDPRSPGALEALVAAMSIPVDTRAPEDVPTDLLSLQNYDLIVLDNVPAYAFTTEQQEFLARYVHDMGGGLIMIGGENSFGAGGWNGTPIEEILPLELDPPKELRLPQAALVLVLDQSGSMNRPVAGARASQQEVANEAAALAIESLRSESLVGVVTFSTHATVYVPLQRNDDPAVIARRVRGITANGGTNLEPALRRAHEMLGNVEADRKRVVCLTDGQSPNDDLEAIVTAMVADNIRLTTIAVGDDADHKTLRKLAEIGQGEFYPVYNPKALPRVLVDSVKSINKPLIKEGPFVPVVRPTGSTLTSALGNAPMLGGLVVTAPRDDPRATVEMTHPDGEPLLAHWQAGLGRVAAFTSDFGGAWSETWRDWPPGAAFWTQLIRATARPAVNHEAELVAEIIDGQLEITLEASDEEGYLDYLRVPGTVYPPQGDAIPVRLQQTAPGVYFTSMPARAAGNYIVALNPMRGTHRLAPVIGGASQATGEEFRRYRSNLAMLDRIVEITGGRHLDLDQPAAADLFDRTGMPTSVSLRPAWSGVLWIVLVLVLFDIAARRIAWSADGIRRVIASAVARVAPAHVRGQEVAATLASLRQVSAEFDARIRTGEQSHRLERQPATEKPPRGDERPEPSRVAAALSALIGRSRPTPPPDVMQEEGPADSPREPDSTGSTETTSGLLAAKRRARRRLEG